MIATIEINKRICTVNLARPIDISIPLSHAEPQPKAWYCENIKIEPVVSGDYIGSTLQGSPVNFKTITLTPHGNGTHTECVGHITTEEYHLNDCLTQFNFLALLVSVEPIKQKDGDMLITRTLLEKTISHFNGDSVQALIVRTIPNNISKLKKDYSGTNPAYFSKEAIEYINSLGIMHLLVDLPSIDKEQDQGKLLAHKAFWEWPNINKNKTITEMIFVKDEVKDGIFLLQLCTASITSDAFPSKPIIYQTSSVS